MCSVCNAINRGIVSPKNIAEIYIDEEVDYDHHSDVLNLIIAKSDPVEVMKYMKEVYESK